MRALPSGLLHGVTQSVRIIDSHHHLWTIGGPGQVWPDASWPALFRDFAMADLRQEADGLALAGTVLVQSQPDERDTAWMIAEAADEPLIRAIVGWTDLLAPDAPARIRALAGNSKLRGLRPMLQAIPATSWVLQPGLAPALAAMIDAGLRFDALVEPRHLPVLDELAERWPALPIVVDHAAKPQARHNQLDPWRGDMARLARHPNVWCKLSGLRTEQDADQHWRALKPYVDHLVACFGERLMWGSDWPVLRHAGDSYGDWVRAADALTELDPERRERLFCGAAAEFYAIELD